MRLCLMVEGQEDVSWEQWHALASTCEAAGLEGLFRSDHYLSVFGIPDRGSLDAMTTLAGLAAKTERIRLGTMVSPATFRHPSVIARSATTVDHISGGRMELGLGAGWYEREHRAFGFPFPDHRTRLEQFVEQLEIVHRQWTQDAFDFAGRHYTLEDCRALPRPRQAPHPPLIVGGSGRPRTIEPAVRFADEYNSPFATVAACRERRRRLDEACARAGRDPASLPFSLMTGCIVGEDRASLLERAQRVVERTGAQAGPADFVREQRETQVIGTVDEVVERLHELEDAGVERVMLQHLAHDDLEMVALLGAEVMPRVTPS